MAAGGLYQGEGESHHCGLSGSRLSEYGGAGIGTEIKREMVYHIPAAVGVGKGGVVEPHSHTTRHRHRHGVALFFERVLFQFHQSLRCSEHGDECRHELGEVACRPLNL